MTDGRRIAEAFLDDPRAAVALLAPDATFHSPVADYEGRERLVPLFEAISHVVGEARATHVLSDDEQTAAFFTATAQDRSIDGVLRVIGDRDVTLMVRPLSALLPAVEEMGRRLAA
jgi:hypothetical protein